MKTLGNEIVSSLSVDLAFEAFKFGQIIQFGSDDDSRSGVILSIHRARNRFTATVKESPGELFTVYFENPL